jgi:hypothetical protein
MAGISVKVLYLQITSCVITSLGPMLMALHQGLSLVLCAPPSAQASGRPLQAGRANRDRQQNSRENKYLPTVRAEQDQPCVL